MAESILSRGTRHERAKSEGDVSPPRSRLGRRESEPHSDEINYLYDVLTTNFPDDRVMWDLHHYFSVDGEQIDIQFDISYFRGLQIPFRLSSYRASQYSGRVPTVAINVLSSSTFRNDVGEIFEQCQLLNIPVYVVFSNHLVNPKYVQAPLLKVYYRDGDKYHVEEIREVCCQADGRVDPSKLIDVLPELVPFKFGVVQRDAQYQRDGVFPLYHLVLIDRETREILPTKMEKVNKQLEEERRRAEEERRRAEEEKRRADLLQEELEKIKKKP